MPTGFLVISIRVCLSLHATFSFNILYGQSINLWHKDPPLVYSLLEINLKFIEVCCHLVDELFTVVYYTNKINTF